MKKVIPLCFCLLVLFSCGNERTCWMCTTKVITAFLDEDQEPPLETTVITEKCDMSQKEINDYEKLLTTIQLFDEYFITMISTTECIEKEH